MSKPSGTPTNPSRSFGESFDLLETLGKGAFSVVKKCRGKVDDLKGKEFAVKIIKTHQLTSKNQFKLERESKICKILKHPNIVSLHLTFSVIVPVLVPIYITFKPVFDFMPRANRYILNYKQ